MADTPQFSGSEVPAAPVVAGPPVTVVKLDESVIPMGWGKGKSTKTILTRTWSDGTQDYKCGDCDYSSPKYASVFSHRSVHSTPETKARVEEFKQRTGGWAGVGRKKALSDPHQETVRQTRILMELADELTTLAVGLNEKSLEAMGTQDLKEKQWKDRALAAERELDRIKRLFASLMSTD